MEALRLDPDYILAKKLRSLVGTVDRLKIEGKEFFEQGNWESAAERYNAAIEVSHFTRFGISLTASHHPRH